MKANSLNSRTGLTACVVVINCAIFAGLVLTPLGSAFSLQQQKQESYEKATRTQQLQQLVRNAKFTEAFALGKQLLADEPEDLQILISTSYAGLRVAITPNPPDAVFAEAPDYAKKTIELIQAGRTPGMGNFIGKDGTLGWLNYALGIYTMKTNPSDAVKCFYEAARHEGVLKNDPQTYVFLARAYIEGPYKKLSEPYKRGNGKPETPETKAALNRLLQIVDRIIDAYARAVAMSATNLELREKREEWMQQLTEIYKFRHNSASGLDEFIGQVLSKPLPSPHDPSTTESKGRQ